MQRSRLHKVGTERPPRHGNGAALTLEERVLEALAAEQLHLAAARKPLSAYQLFHMHRVAELKEVTPGGIKHCNAFKRAAHDWTAMPKERRDFYVQCTSVKPILQHKECAATIASVANDLPAVDCPLWVAIHGGLPVIDVDDAFEFYTPLELQDMSLCPQCESPVDGVSAPCLFCNVHGL